MDVEQPMRPLFICPGFAASAAAAALLLLLLLVLLLLSLSSLPMLPVLVVVLLMLLLLLCLFCSVFRCYVASVQNRAGSGRPLPLPCGRCANERKRQPETSRPRRGPATLPWPPPPGGLTYRPPCRNIFDVGVRTCCTDGS